MNDREMIINAMDTLMFDTGTLIAGSVSRYVCVYFRPRQPTDKIFLTIQYGNGCNAHVRPQNFSFVQLMNPLGWLLVK
jgi:hypothetical protein